MRHDHRTNAVLAVALALLASLDGCEGITCYFCTIHPPSGRLNQTAKLCSMFDYSNHFHIDCPYSTFCMKTTSEMTLQQDKKVQVSERGCAPQKWNEHVYRDGNWQSENKIDREVYSAGCHSERSLGVRNAETEYCYCATNLCNSAHKDPLNPTALAALLLPLLGLR